MMRGAIFDMDGVLVDNAACHMQAFEIFCRRYGVTGWREKLQHAFGMGNDDIMRLIMPAEAIREKGLAGLSDEKEAIYREIYRPAMRPVAGLIDLLEMFRKAGIRCAVGSSGCRDNVDFVLDECGIRPFFDTQVNGDMVARCKPDPEIYRTAAEKLDLDPACCIVFEDAKAGIQAAKSAGIGQVVALATTLPPEELRQTEADRIVRDFCAFASAEAFNELINR